MSSRQLAMFGVKPTRKPTKAEQRDLVLSALQKHRAECIEKARRIAEPIAEDRGTVTSDEVFVAMRAAGLGYLLDAFDRRWMGAVFRDKRFAKTGEYVNEGSHGRAIPRWRLARKAAA